MRLRDPIGMGVMAAIGLTIGGGFALNWIYDWLPSFLDFRAADILSMAVVGLTIPLGLVAILFIYLIGLLSIFFPALATVVELYANPLLFVALVVYWPALMIFILWFAKNVVHALRSKKAN